MPRSMKKTWALHVSLQMLLISKHGGDESSSLQALNFLPTSRCLFPWALKVFQESGSLSFDRAQRLSDTFITRQTQLLHLIIPGVHFSSLWTFSDRSLQSMMKEKPSDPTLELLSALPLAVLHMVGFDWVGVIASGEIDGNQTPSWTLRNLLTARWLVAWAGARVRPWLRG